MDTAGADDAGDPLHPLARDRLSWPPPLSHPSTAKQTKHNKTQHQQNEKRSYENETQHPQ
jgi:hypothetical protein